MDQNIDPMQPRCGFDRKKISDSLNNDIDQVDTKCGSYGFQMWVPWIQNMDLVDQHVDPVDAKCGSRES